MNVSILDEAYSFYALSELRGYLADKKVMGPYRFYVEGLYQRHVSRFAEEICDYLSVVAFGEALHGVRRCYKARLDFENSPEEHQRIASMYPSSRERAYCELAKTFEQRVMLDTISTLFNYNWRDGFGGKSWKKIADLAIRYLDNDITPALFIDYAINLHHNGGNVFNKPYLFKDWERLNTFLNCRRDWKSIFVPFERMVWTQYRQNVSHEFYELLLAWHYFEVYPDAYCPIIRNYPSTGSWGNSALVLVERTIENTDRPNEDYGDDEGGDDEEECEDECPVEAPVKLSLDEKLEIIFNQGPYVPVGISKAAVASFIKGKLITDADYRVRITPHYTSACIVEDSEKKSGVVFKSGGFSLACGCSFCDKTVIWLLYKYENAFHEYLKSGGNPTIYKEPETTKLLGNFTDVKVSKNAKYTTTFETVLLSKEEKFVGIKGA